MQRFCLVLDILQCDAAHTTNRFCKVFVDYFLADADRLKNLRALIGLDRGNTHLRRDLDDAVQHCRIVIIDRRIVILLDHLIVDELADGILRQIRVNRAGSVAQKRGKMMHLARLAGFQNDRKRCSLLRLYKILMHRRYRKQRRDRHMVLIHAAVSQHKNVRAVAVRLVNLHEQTLNRTLDAGALIICDRHLRHLKAIHLHMLDLQHIGICEDRVIHLQYLAVFRRLLQKIAVLTDINGCRGDNFLADRVDRRICYLREQLLKVVKQRLLLVRKHGKRRVDTHGSNALRAV